MWNYLATLEATATINWLQLFMILVPLSYLYLKHVQQQFDVPVLIKLGIGAVLGWTVMDIVGDVPSLAALPLISPTDPMHFLLKDVVFGIIGFGLLFWGACVELFRRLRLQEQLGKEQHFRQAVLSSLEAGVIVLDQEQEVLYSNPKAAEVHSPTSPLGNLLHQEDGVLQVCTIGAKTFHVSRKPIPGSGGQPGLTVCSWWDVSDWDRRVQLSQEFVSAVSHELRTPLTAIKGYVELIAENQEVVQNYSEYLEVVQSNVDRLVLLVEDLLDLSRIEAGMTQLHLQTYEIGILVRQAVECFVAEAQAKHLTLELAIPEEPLLVTTDRDRLQQVLSNLLSNACKYTLDGGRVTVHVRGQPGEVTITVADTGIGIPAEEQPKIFTRFFRSSASRRLQVKGTGLGLAITKSLVERLGGVIWFTSEPGTGTSFSIALPGPPASLPGPEQAHSSSDTQGTPSSMV
ncbi:MAG: HAMP domain-containing histidine kinase [Chloroflexi bacterium]|nr:HAMP domain-containing histidine kinase [Chloroflexota bacterium]